MLRQHLDPRPRRHSARRDVLPEPAPTRVFLPDALDPIVVADVVDALELSERLERIPFGRDALVLLDAARVVTAIFCDPPAKAVLFPSWMSGAGFDLPFSHTVAVERARLARHDGPHPFDLDGFRSLRRVHERQGLHLLDVLLTDGDEVVSLALADDPLRAWRCDGCAGLRPTARATA
jgi:hypothetical protein